MTSGHAIVAALAAAFCMVVQAGEAPRPTLEMFQAGGTCYDRAAMPSTAVVDSHLHFRPFGGPAVPFREMVSHLERAGVLFANVYGIGQSLPAHSDCTYYLDCPGTPVLPTLKNDFVNAANFVAERPKNVVLTLSMTFPDLADPQSVMDGMDLLDREFPGLFRWMGEVNLVKQALFNNGHQPVPLPTIRQWAPFMARLRERDMPIAIHSDLGHNADLTEFLPWISEVLHLYPENKIVWMHLGLSRELVIVDAPRHIAEMQDLLQRHPNLMIDLSWRVLEDEVLSQPDKRPLYIDFINAHPSRFLPGTDFVAAGSKTFADYQEDLKVTGRIHELLSDEAFRRIALGENYFRLLDLDYSAPPICADRPAPESALVD